MVDFDQLAGLKACKKAAEKEGKKIEKTAKRIGSSLKSQTEANDQIDEHLKAMSKFSESLRSISRKTKKKEVVILQPSQKVGVVAVRHIGSSKKYLESTDKPLMLPEPRYSTSSMSSLNLEPSPIASKLASQHVRLGHARAATAFVELHNLQIRDNQTKSNDEFNVGRDKKDQEATKKDQYYLTTMIKNRDVPIALSTLFAIREALGGAICSYRRALKMDPQSVSALQSLACALIYTEQNYPSHVNVSTDSQSKKPHDAKSKNSSPIEEVIFKTRDCIVFKNFILTFLLLLGDLLF